MIDALIIGGGPAGATTALLLARAGWSVAVVEKKAFPRPKVCGEFISATSLPLMHELGIVDFYQTHAGPPVRRVGWFGKNKMLTATMPAAHNPLSEWGRALGRDHLDTTLLKAAEKAGAQIWQPWKAEQIERQDTYATCHLTSPTNTAEIMARHVIIGHGSWEKPVLKTKVPPHKNTDLLAFKTHFKNTTLDIDLMPMISFPGGYGGLVHSNEDRVSLSCCIRRDMLQKIRTVQPGIAAGDAVLNYITDQCIGVRNVLASANRSDPWMAVGPLYPGIRQCYKNNIFYVGNIAGEAHPIIAEGISMAMQSGWLLANTLISLSANTQDYQGQLYTKKWRKQFASRIWAARLFSAIATRNSGMKIVLPILEHFPGLLTFCAALSGKTTSL